MTTTTGIFFPYPSMPECRDDATGGRIVRPRGLATSGLLARGILLATLLHPLQAQLNHAGLSGRSRSDALNPEKIKQDEARLLGVLSDDPENAGALAGMGWVRSRQGNYLGAISYLEKARQKRPNDHALTVALDLARFRMTMKEARISLSAGDLKAAEKYYLLALQIRPHNSEALAGFCTSLIKTGFPPFY